MSKNNDAKISLNNNKDNHNLLINSNKF
jgi:hypothetical protein